MQRNYESPEFAKELTDWSIYRSYVFQRTRYPHVEPTRWKALYLSQEIFEQKYQQEKKMTEEKKLREEIISYLEMAYSEDDKLNDILADHFLEGEDSYLYWKQEEDDVLESVYDTLEDDFVEYLEKNPRKQINVRTLVEKIYNLKVA